MTTIDEIKARCAAATAGPWLSLPSGAIKNADSLLDWVASVQVSNCPNWRNDAEFIAAARSDIPLLVKALELACESLAHFRDPSKNAEYWLELAEKELK